MSALNVFIYILRDVLTTQLDTVHHLAGTGLAYWLTTEQGSQPHVWAWADEVLAWTPDWTLGHVTLEHLADVPATLDVVDAHADGAGCVLAASRTGVLADLAVQLGADRAGDGNVPVGVLDVHGRASWVLVVLRLGGVLETLFRLDDVLALCSLHDDTTLYVHKVGRFHFFVLLQEKIK